MSTGTLGMDASPSNQCPFSLSRRQFRCLSSSYRDTMGRLGLSQCLTPSGVPYVTTRGGPLVGEELLLLQGIPAEDLLLTKETEKNLKDLAGNAMSTTVVGACMISALIVGQAAIGASQSKTSKATLLPSLVPRPLALSNGEIAVTRELAMYAENSLPMGPLGDDQSLAL